MTKIATTMGLKEWLLLIGLSILWGGSFFFVGVAVAEVPTLVMVFIRVGLAALMLWLLVWWRHIPIPGSLTLWGSFFVMGLLNNVIPFSLIVWGQSHISTGLASILNATTPLFTVLVASIFLLDERMTPNKIIGVIIGFVGTVIMVGPAALGGLLVDAMAQFAVLGAALSYAFAGVFGRRFKAFNLHPLLVAAGQLTASTIILLPLVLSFHKPVDFLLPSTYSLLALISLALFSTALAYIIYFRILASSGASNIALVTFLVPISAIMLGVLVLNESLSQLHILGMAIIACGLLVMDGRLLARFFPRAKNL